MQTINIVYISLSGNTEYFINQLANHIEKNYGKYVKKINVKKLYKEDRDFPEMCDSYVAFLPSYLEGGNGVDSGYKEILTTPLKDFLRSNDNYKKCLGIIGSGNKNFNKQFCLTALQYSSEFDFPVLDTFELMGTYEDVIRISKNIVEKANL